MRLPPKVAERSIQLMANQDTIALFLLALL